MSTRSLIGYKDADGNISVVYCHFDGYLEGVGATLTENYNSDELAKALVAGGDISSVGKTLAETAYYAARGEELKVSKVKGLEGFLSCADPVWHEYLYLWNGSRWDYAKGGKANYNRWQKVPKAA